MTHSIRGEDTRTPLISVVIPTCLRPDLLARCLDCLAPGTQTLPPEQYEVVVSDDAPLGQTAQDRLAARYPWARWTPGPRRGPAANRNHGASEAAAPWLAFTDDDCLPAPGWLQAYADALRPGIAVYEGRTTCEGRHPGPLEHSPINLVGGQLWSCNMMIGKGALAAVGGFDENYPHAHMEDTDLRERLKAAGYAFPFIPDATVDHPPRPRHWRSLAASQESEMVYWYKQGHTQPFGGRLFRQFARYRLSVIKRTLLRGGELPDALRAALFLPAELGYLASHVRAWDRKYKRRYADVPKVAGAP